MAKWFDDVWSLPTSKAGRWLRSTQRVGGIDPGRSHRRVHLGNRECATLLHD